MVTNFNCSHAHVCMGNNNGKALLLTTFVPYLYYFAIHYSKVYLRNNIPSHTLKILQPEISDLTSCKGNIQPEGLLHLCEQPFTLPTSNFPKSTLKPFLCRRSGYIRCRWPSFPSTDAAGYARI